MITCHNCGHTNPDSATQCEACFAPLSELSNCPNCGASVAVDALFCAQCGVSLHVQALESQPIGPGVDPLAPTHMGTMTPGSDADILPPAEDTVGGLTAYAAVPPTEVNLAVEPGGEVPGFEETAMVAPAFEPDHQQSDSMPAAGDVEESGAGINGADVYNPEAATGSVNVDLPLDAFEPESELAQGQTPSGTDLPIIDPEGVRSQSVDAAEIQGSSEPVSAPTAGTTFRGSEATQIQLPPRVRLIHVRSGASLDIPLHLEVIHIGKPNDRIPPDLDVSGFIDSDVVSRIHADLRMEGDGYYLEDMGSSNGTYVNNQPLRPGDRFRLRPGDRISLGKEDKVSFTFELDVR